MGRPHHSREANGPARPGARASAFPCGHVESGDSVDRRTRATERAAWVRCRACNVIGLVVRRTGQR